LDVGERLQSIRKIKGLLNTGHGTLGWTMACGSGRFLADVMAKKTPQISAEGLDISRYGNHQETAKHVNPAPAHQ